MTPPDARPVDLYVVWVLAFGGLVVAFPFYGYLAFGLGYYQARESEAIAR